MSTDEEIRSVYEADIAAKSRVIWTRPDGYLHFYDGLYGMRIKNMFSQEERAMLRKLQRICANDTE
jgi:hypothetical protein